MKILRCICCECGRLRIRDKELKARIARKSSARTRFKKIFEACSKIRACEQKKEADGDDFEIGCGQIQPKYTREGLTIIRDGRDDAGRGQATMAHGDPRNIFKAKDVIKVFQKIRADELRLMGMDPERSRPEWMIIRKLTVAPPPVRPSVEEGGGARSNDDLTVAYTQIIRKNNELMRMEGRPPDRMQ
jgi:DNA-directed RNA polymerase beta' subunit